MCSSVLYFRYDDVALDSKRLSQPVPLKDLASDPLSDILLCVMMDVRTPMQLTIVFQQLLAI